jgi:DNA primase
VLAPEALLEAVALAGLVAHPALIDDFAEALEGTPWTREDHARLARALLAVPGHLDFEATAERLDGPDLETLMSQRHVRLLPGLRPDAEDEAARACVADALARLAARRGAEDEAREALEDFAEGGDEALTWRLAEAARRRHAALRVGQEDGGDDDEAAASSYLQGLLDRKVWEKNGRR